MQARRPPVFMLIAILAASSVGESARADTLRPGATGLGEKIVCIGDCDRDGRVTVDELLSGARIILGSGSCPAYSGGQSIAIPELVTAVNNALLGCSSDRNLLVVQTDTGAVRGVAVDNGRSFLGIPYAESLHRTRWYPPRPVKRWTNELDASRPGSPCLQIDDSGNVTGVESCLSLNVHTPNPSTRLRPVMVWIHGGGFSQGDALVDGATDGSILAQQGDVVVVSLNYRLGPFGFLAHPDLGLSLNGPANLGLHDQVAALEWVKRNIESFGGDPENVTLFGQGSGGTSVCVHLVSPRSAGLFHRAIVESGACAYPLPTIAAGEQAGMAFEATLRKDQGCEASDYDCPWTADNLGFYLLRAAPRDVSFGQVPLRSGAFLPVIDGDLIPQEIGAALRSGAFHRVPILMGSSASDGSALVAERFVGGPLAFAERDYRNALNVLFGSSSTGRILAAIPPDTNGSPLQTLVAVVGDALFACPSVDAAIAASNHVATYVYRINPPDAGISRVTALEFGTYNDTEIPYAFGSSSNRPLTPDGQALSDRMIAYWTNFARRGDPNGDGLPAWPALEANGQMMMLGPGIATTTLDRDASCGLWDALGIYAPRWDDPLQARRENLEINRERWRKHRIDSYRITEENTCFFCDPAAVVTVREGKIVSIVDSRGNDISDTRPYIPFRTIDEVFDFIDSNLRSRPFELSAQYDPEFGYPTRVYVDRRNRVADDELAIAIDAFERIDPDL